MKDNKKPMGRPKGSTRKRFTKAEQQDFLNESVEYVFNTHASWTDYKEWCKDKHNLSENQSNNYWKQVFQSVKERYQLDRDKEIDKHIYHLWSLYEKSVDKGDYNTARQVLLDLSKLKGLNEPDKVDLTTQQEIIFKFGNEE